MVKKGIIQPVSVFGWPGRMTAMETAICQMSLMYNKNGKAILQLGQKFDIDRVGGTALPSGKPLWCSVYLSTGEGRVVYWKPYGIYIDVDRNTFPWVNKEMLGKGINPDGCPDSIQERVLRIAVEWTEMGRKFLTHHIREDEDIASFERLRLFIGTLGRDTKYSRDKKRVHTSSPDPSDVSKPERTVDKTTSE